MIIATDIRSSIVRAQDITTPRAISTAILSSNSVSYGTQEIYVSEFDPSIHGYALIAPTSSRILDEYRIGPNHIDSIGSLREQPGVGWK